MQSILAYHRLGHAVRKQTQQDEEKHIDSPPGNSSPSIDIDGAGIVEAQEHKQNEELNPTRSIEAESLSPSSPHDEADPNFLHETVTATRSATRQAEASKFGHALDGVEARYRNTHEGKDGRVFVVGWNGPNDPFNPHNFGALNKARIIVTVGFVGFVVTMASSIDSAVLPQAADEFGVSEVVESLATASYLIAFGLGTLIAGPLSETFGRNPVYIGFLLAFIIWEMGSALAPNIGAQIVFRFLAGLSGSPALTLSGGTVADLYDPLEKTFGFPLFTLPAFIGPMVGPVIAAYIGPSPHISWRWADWISMILGGLMLAIVMLFQPETYAPILLKWRAQHLRRLTGDDRFRAETEVIKQTFLGKVKTALARPFVMVVTEPIIILMTLYFTVFYIVLFTFFVGYPTIFGDVYGLSQGLTFTIFVAMAIGVLLSAILVPIIYFWTKKHLQEQKASGKVGVAPEQRLWFAMLGGSLSLPISLFWMGWTDFVGFSSSEPQMHVH